MNNHGQQRTYVPEDCAVFRVTTEKYGGLSNMAGGFPLYVNNKVVWSSEALYQACRFPLRPDIQEMILAERSPMTAKMKSKKYRKEFSRPDWNTVKVKVMKWCLRVKLAQNWERFGQLLCSTNNKPIVEESRKDDFWGAERSNNGLLIGMNVLGRLLMELRQELTLPNSESLKFVPVPDISNFLLLSEPIHAINPGSVPIQEIKKAATFKQRAISQTRHLRYAESSASTKVPPILWPISDKTDLVMFQRTIDPATMPERCYTMLKSLNEFDNKEIRGIIQGLITKTNRDNCFIGLYYRAKANVESLLALDKVKHFQAIAMLARALFELLVDIKLIDIIPNAVEKIITFSEVEKLRAAKRIVSFKSANPNATVDTAIYDNFISANAFRIESGMNGLWPGIKKLVHWSGRALAERVLLLNAPFEEIYATEYAKLSWYVHSSLTGFANLKSETFEMLAGSQNKLAGECYVLLLTAIVDEFAVEKADAKIKRKLDLAKYVPFTDGPDEARALEMELLG